MDSTNMRIKGNFLEEVLVLFVRCFGRFYFEILRIYRMFFGEELVCRNFHVFRLNFCGIVLKCEFGE